MSIQLHKVYRYTLGGLRHVADSSHEDRLLFINDDDEAIVYNVVTKRHISCPTSVDSESYVMLAHEDPPAYIIAADLDERARVLTYEPGIKIYTVIPRQTENGEVEQCT